MDGPPVKATNILYLRPTRSPQFYNYLVKQLYHQYEFKEVKLYAVGEFLIQILFQAVAILTSAGYSSIKEIRPNYMRKEDESNDIAVPTLSVVLERTPDFEKLYDYYNQII